MNNTFYEDMARGEIGENVFQEWCSKNNYPLRDVRQDWNYWGKDIDFISQDGVLFEVKTDFTSERTGNFAVEIMKDFEDGQFSKDGWFYKTKADYIIFVQPNEQKIFCISLCDLKYIISVSNPTIKHIVDYGCVTYFYVIPFRRHQEFKEITDSKCPENNNLRALFNPENKIANNAEKIGDISQENITATQRGLDNEKI